MPEWLPSWYMSHILVLEQQLLFFGWQVPVLLFLAYLGIPLPPPPLFYPMLLNHTLEHA